MDAREYQYGNVTIRISRPELTKAEQIAQEKKILTALQQIGKEMKEKKTWQQ